jgi:hypothetical protein
MLKLIHLAKHEPTPTEKTHFSSSHSLDIISTKREKVPVDARRQVLLSSNNFPSITNSTMGESAPGYLDPKFDSYSLIS